MRATRRQKAEEGGATLVERDKRIDMVEGKGRSDLRRVMTTWRHVINRCYLAGEDPVEVLADVAKTVPALGGVPARSASQVVGSLLSDFLQLGSWCGVLPLDETGKALVGIQTAPSLPPPAGVGKPDKHNINIISDMDGKLKRAATLDVASRFGGVSRRAIERAVKKGPLEAEGERQNRLILGRSLESTYSRAIPPEVLSSRKIMRPNAT